MSEYTGKNTSGEIICPYCGYIHQPSLEEEFDNQAKPTECDSCGMFYHQYSIYKSMVGGELSPPDYYTSPDCRLNGKKHEWKVMPNPFGGEYRECTGCGEARELLRSKPVSIL